MPSDLTLSLPGVHGLSGKLDAMKGTGTELHRADGLFQEVLQVLWAYLCGSMAPTCK